MPHVKFLHTADVHLDWPFAGLGSGGDLKARLRREELKSIFAAIIDLAIREQVDLLLIAGDLFEHKYATRGTMQFLDEQFRRFGGPVFISPGNHDPYVAGSYYETYPWAPNVRIFGPEPERIDLDGLPVSVRGWGFPTWEVRECQLQRFPPPAAGGRVNLVVVHGGDAAYHPFDSDDLAALGADYIALGHIHKEGVLLERAGRVIARYSGSPDALSFGEPGEHGVVIGTVSPDETRLRWVPTGLRRYSTADVDVTGAVSLEDVAARLLRAFPSEERSVNCYRLTLTGAVDPSLTVDVAVLQERLAPEFYVLRLTDATAPEADLAALACERSARGLFVQRLLGMEAAEADAGRRRVIRRALAHGLAAFAQKGGAS
ncbi:MAG: hypothetical protein K0R39_2342 [Symbiobacteriaceae bacterium]|nr:hypothetical protein [Symbiobacteriaceae bacterium]